MSGETVQPGLVVCGRCGVRMFESPGGSSVEMQERQFVYRGSHESEFVVFSGVFCSWLCALVEVSGKAGVAVDDVSVLVRHAREGFAEMVRSLEERMSRLAAMQSLSLSPTVVEGSYLSRLRSGIGALDRALGFLDRFGDDTEEDS